MISDKTKLLMFDMDGLLVDTERIYMEGWLYALKKRKVNIHEDVVRSWVGKSFHDSTAYLMRACHDEALCTRIREDRESYIYQCLQDGSLKEKPYALDALQAAKEYGYQNALVTSSLKKRSLAILKHLGLLPYLDVLVFANDVQRLKPYPDLYAMALKRAGCMAEEAVAFEDSRTGAQAACAAGINTVLIPDPYFHDREKPLVHVEYAENLSIVRTMLRSLKM